MSWLTLEPNLRLRVGWHVRIFVALALLVGFVLRFQRLPAPENAAGALPVGNAKGIFQGKHPNFHSQDLSANLYVQHSTVATAITTATTMPNSVSLSVGVVARTNALAVGLPAFVACAAFCSCEHFSQGRQARPLIRTNSRRDVSSASLSS